MNNEISPYLNADELRQIEHLSEKLLYKPTSRILPQIFEWVKTGHINKTEFKLLITYYFGDLK